MSQKKFTIDKLTNMVGQEIAQSEWMMINQQRIQAFGNCTDDHQWIHMDPEKAKSEGGYDGTIAHGFLTLSLLSPIHLNADYIPEEAKQVINYGLDKVRFMTPVKSGSRVRGKIELIECRPRGRNMYMITTKNIIEIENEKKPALTSELSTLITV